MSSTSRAEAALVALFAAAPATIIIIIIIWELFVYINNGSALDPYQVFLTIFSGFSFGLAIFSFLYKSRIRA